MNKSIINIFQINSIFCRCRSQIPFRKEPHFRILGQNNPHSDIKFAFINKQRSFNIFLNNKCIEFNSVCPIRFRFYRTRCWQHNTSLWIFHAFLLVHKQRLILNHQFLLKLHLQLLLLVNRIRLYYLCSSSTCFRFFFTFCFFTYTILLNQFVKSFQISKNMDTSTSIQMCWFQNP